MTPVGVAHRVAQVLAAFAATIALTALVLVAAGGQAWGRGQLDFGFGGVPDQASQVASIFTNNAKVVLLCAFCAFIVQAGRWALETDGAVRGLRIGCDLALITQAAVNLITVGIACGAYGTRMIHALLPHGPVELLAFALAASLYLHVRRSPITWSTGLTLTATSLLTLLVAAFVETYLEV